MRRAERHSSGSSSRLGWSLLETVGCYWLQLQVLLACFPLTERWSREGSVPEWGTSHRSDPRIGPTRPNHHRRLRLSERLRLLRLWRQRTEGQPQRHWLGTRMLAERPVEGLGLSLGRPGRSLQSHHHPPQLSQRALQWADSQRYRRVHQRRLQCCHSVSEALDQID